MTLFNQINSLLIGLFLLVVTGLTYFQFTQTKTFMNNQISSDLNNTANMLALMLKPHLETDDIASAEIIINTISESGLYKKVTLTWFENGENQVWENPVQINSVPEWFINLELFDIQSTESTINNGLMQLATLKLEANPAISYSQLWKVMKDTLITLTILFIFSVIILRLRLTKILAPLHRVANQAKLIAKREFQPDLDIPEIIELKEVVLAINGMSNQLQTVFSQLDKEVVALKNEKLTDEVSQLPNRLYLNGQLGSWMKDPGYGGVLIARLNCLQEIDDKFGYQVRDSIIQILAKEMQDSLPLIAPCVIARISSREFVFLVTKASKEQLKVYLQNVIRLINQAMISANYQKEDQFSIGVAVRAQGMTASQLLGNADSALQVALSENQVCQWFENNEKQELTISQWRDLLQEAIVERNFLLQWHPALSFFDGTVMQREVYSGLKIEANVIRATQFMPYIEQLELGSEFDQSLLKVISGNSTALSKQEKIAINITQDSVLDLHFHDCLELFMSRQKNTNRFHFEIQESTVLTYPKQSQKFTNIVKQQGAKVGIDHYGREIGSVAYLQSIKPDYVKLDQSLSCNLKAEMEVDELTERLALSRAVINTARGLGIEVIITAVEDQEQLNMLKSLNANGYQGFITSPTYIS